MTAQDINQEGMVSDVEPHERNTPASDAPQVAPTAPEPSMFRDPAVRLMSYVAIGLVVLFLATLVGALATGVISSSSGARTAAERQLLIAAAAVSAPGATGETWGPYIDALVAAGDLRQAQVALDRARASVTATLAPDLDLSEARLLRAKEHYEQAVDMADKAMQGYVAEAAARAAAQGGTTYVGRGANYYNAALVKGSACVELGRWKDAVEAFDVYLVQYPESADILVDRGNAKIGMKDNVGAEKDFREALRFVPYDEEAKAGLKKIGVAQ
jgi:tetratricopeptide (TPR) repeat protein